MSPLPKLAISVQYVVSSDLAGLHVIWMDYKIRMMKFMDPHVIKSFLHNSLKEYVEDFLKK